MPRVITVPQATLIRAKRYLLADGLVALCRNFDALRYNAIRLRAVVIAIRVSGSVCGDQLAAIGPPPPCRLRGADTLPLDQVMIGAELIANGAPKTPATAVILLCGVEVCVK